MIKALQEARINPAMKSEFREAFRDSGCSWLEYIGQPMVYDGALFVRRDQLPADEEAVALQAIRRTICSNADPIKPLS